MSRLQGLARRATEPELLDLGVPEPEVRRSLADLRFVNRWLAGRGALLQAVRPHLRGGGRLLDVGCGSADQPAFLKRRSSGPVHDVGVDIKLLHVRDVPPDVRAVVADVHHLPFADRSFDVVTASHFLHHFADDQIPSLLGGLYRLTRGAVVVNDLHRHVVPLLFGRVFFPVLFRSPVSVSDGLLSIRRGFRPGELRAAFTAAGLPHASIRRRFPFRLLAVASRASGERRRNGEG
jgi:SAM-dependent methyltransferase